MTEFIELRFYSARDRGAKYCDEHVCPCVCVCVCVCARARALDVAGQLKCSAHAAVGLAINCAQ